MRKPGRRERTNAGSAKSRRRMEEQRSGGSVCPRPWNTLELVKINPTARKFMEMMRRYSDPKAITSGSEEKAPIIDSGAMWLRSVNRIIRAETRREADLNVWRTRSPRPAPKFCPARGAVAKAMAITGRNIDCITRAPMPKPAWAEVPKCRMIQ
jgi:hypothetical protein